MRLNSGNRADRRAALASERQAKAGDWGPWETMNLSDGIPGGRGWCAEVSAVRRNRIYVVLQRPIMTPDGHGWHLAIRTASGAEPPWRDMQRIKNELFGHERTAVEVMPAEASKVDEADMYHMWVLPEAMKLHFGLQNGGRPE